MTIVFALIAIAAMVLLLAGSSTRIITQYERGVVLRFGQLREATRGPGLTLITRNAGAGCSGKHEANARHRRIPAVAHPFGCGVVERLEVVSLPGTAIQPGHLRPCASITVMLSGRS